MNNLVSRPAYAVRENSPLNPPEGDLYNKNKLQSHPPGGDILR